MRGDQSSRRSGRRNIDEARGLILKMKIGGGFLFRGLQGKHSRRDRRQRARVEEVGGEEVVLLKASHEDEDEWRMFC